jgi:hypothetical protein
MVVLLVVGRFVLLLFQLLLLLPKIGSVIGHG